VIVHYGGRRRSTQPGASASNYRPNALEGAGGKQIEVYRAARLIPEHPASEPDRRALSPYRSAVGGAPLPKLTPSDLADLAIARAEHHRHRRAKGQLDVVDRQALWLATSLKTDGLVALLRRKPLLAEFEPAAYQAIVDAIAEAEKASPRERGKKRTEVLHKVLAAEVNFRMTHWAMPLYSGDEPDIEIEPALPKKPLKKTVMHTVATRHGVDFRTVERACQQHGVRRAKAPKER
jgi:hypothetical protein